ncbi:trehalose-6-phosphate synthase [Halocella sp. SP3-1]|uniref:alpha,alpha-trehalose-phosphate synthase (UDP-forming) n=1 Tax=Halocella sp. SP3-1 TaxID=2382161 RepID=UPI000F75F47C|nr:trehalose-6-phosphate synthase [Halocella sp. SP3-1]AZO94285.1 trehalose-6-phosphate synthase [Halocella sp. SP3-1]
MNNNRLILVSNGEPYAHEKKNGKIKCIKLAGGLTTGLDPLMQEEKGVWVAWGRGQADFEVVDENSKVIVPDKDGYELKRIKLSKKDIAGFYHGFSNEILWPICHSFIEKANFKREYWDVYERINQRYAEAALEEANADDYIWIHDYHLALVPELIRQKNKKTRLAFFWHIPWPAWESFRTIPWRNILIRQILASDFIAFHTQSYVKNFLNCAQKIGAKIDRKKNTIKFNGHQTKVTAIPLGVDYQSFAVKSKDMDQKVKKIKELYSAEKLIFGVDRLDYTKGILERLQAVDHLFEKHPEYIKKVTLVQRVSPSRTGVEEYQDMREEINRTIGDINGRYQRDGWTPIKYFHQFMEQDDLLPYYNAADVALITPLIDGMNLVAKEYVAASNNGMLILSEFAGAAEAMKDALQVNPYDVEGVTETIHQALEMPEWEKTERMHRLKEKVRKYDLNWWRDLFLKEWKGVYEQKIIHK